MNKIMNAFENKKALLGFLTAGDPTFEASCENILAMAKAGADLIEIGIPFSDPIAEGPVIQAANIRALSKGMTTDRAFDLVERVRKDTNVPVCFMTYLNPVFKYGYDRFFSRCAKLGIDGLICPDMPFEEKEEAAEVARKYDVSVISLIAPTGEERIKMIAESAEGFLYIVPPIGGTGSCGDFISVMQSVKRYAKIPSTIGSEISTPEQAKQIADISDGVIIGSSAVSLVERYGENAAPKIYEYVKCLADAVHGDTQSSVVC